MPEQRFDFLLVIVEVDRVHSRRDLDRDPGLNRHPDGGCGALLWRDSPKEDEVAAVPPAHVVNLPQPEAMVHGGHPVQPQVRHRRPLSVGDRYQGLLWMHREERSQLGQVEAPVKGGHEGRPQPVHGQPGQVVHVGMNHIELTGPAYYLLDLQDAVGERIGGVHLPKWLWADGHQLTRPLGGARAEEDQFVASAPAEFLAEGVHHPLGAAVLVRRNTNEQRSHLCDSHRSHLLLIDGSVAALKEVMAR